MIEEFNNDTKEFVNLDLGEYIMTNPEIFEPGAEITVELSIKNFSSQTGKDFKLQYSF